MEPSEENSQRQQPEQNAPDPPQPEKAEEKGGEEAKEKEVPRLEADDVKEVKPTTGKPPRKDLVAWLSFLVAALALLLSQFKPLYTYFERAELIVELNENLYITHNMGVLYLTPTISYGNNGSKSGSFKDFDILIKNDQGYAKVLEARYFSSPNGQYTYYSDIPRMPYNGATITEKHIYQAKFQYYEELDPEYRTKLQLLFARVGQELGPYNPSEPNRDSISEELFREIELLTQQGLEGLTATTYELLFVFWGEDPEEPIAKELFQMSLVEGNLIQLDAITRGYLFGERISRPDARGGGVATELSPVEDSEKIEGVFQEYLSLKSADN